MRSIVLIIAKDAQVRSRVNRIVRLAGYAVELAEGEKRARRLIAEGQIDAAIIAPASLGSGGLRLIRELQDTVGRVIVLADKTEDAGRLAGAIADTDVIVATASDEQHLLERLSEVMSAPRRSDAQPAGDLLRLSFEGGSLDLAGRTFLDGDGREVPLTHAEFELLATFARSPGRVLSRDQLRTTIGGRGAEPYDRSIDMLVGRLRRKIEPEPKSPRFIRTVPGAGYKFTGRTRRADVPAAETTAPGRDATEISPTRFERRFMTVVACRMVGLGALAARLEPEDLHVTIGSVHQACADVVARFRGLPVKIPGDTLLAYFGYPDAQEDDAERAVRAALDLTRLAPRIGAEASARLHLHIGIATGLMIVANQPGRSRDDEQSASGEPLSLAFQLRSVAAPNGIVVASSTRALIGRFFECQKVGPVVLEEGLDPVAAWRVITEGAAPSRFEALRRPDMLQMVDRDEEMELLWRRWLRARGGGGQVVILSGEAGIGKSRLVAELELQTSTEARSCLHFFGLPHQTDASLSAVVRELQQAAGFERGDAAHERLARLAAHLAACGPGAAEGIGLIAQLLALPTPADPAVAQLAPQKRKEKTFAALLVRIEALAASGPVLVVADDVQWIDPTSLEFLTLVAERISSLPVLMLVAARPEFSSPWSGYPHVSVLALPRFSRRDSELLLDLVAGGRTLPREAKDHILAPTEGVPLFIEELTKTVLESRLSLDSPGNYDMEGTGLVSIPQTLHGSLLARLDHLGPAKEVAQIAAVLGREFSYELLRAVAAVPDSALGAALDRLVSSELVFGRGAPPLASYVFKHALVRDAAYGMLLRARRQQLHGTIARVLEENFRDVVEAQPELLAYHHREAGNTAEAVAYLSTAAERSLSRSALTEALAQLTQGLELISGLPEDDQRRGQELNLQVALGRAMLARRGYTAPETEHAYRRARVLCEALNDQRSLPLVVLGLGITAWIAGNYRSALRQAQELHDWADRESDEAGRAVGHLLFGLSLTMMGELDDARRHLERGLAIGQFALPGRQPFIASDTDGRIASWAFLHHCRLLLGWPAQARAAADQALASRPTQLYSAAMACNQTVRIHVLERDDRSVETTTTILQTLADEQGYPLFSASSKVYRGWLLARGGEPAAGVRLCHEGIAQVRAIGSICNLSFYLALLAECHETAGHDVEGGLRALQEALQTSEETGGRIWEAELHRLKGRLLLRRGSAQREAELSFIQSLAVARSHNARLFELRAATDLAWLLVRKGERAKAHNVLAPVYGWFTEGYDNIDLVEAKALLDTLQ